MRFALFAFVVLASVASAAEPKAKSWTVDDVIHQESAGDFHFSPDSKSLVWVKTAPGLGQKTMVSHLHRIDLPEGRDVTLTRGSDSCTSPSWSPDGKLLAFLSSRPAPKKDEDKRRSSKRSKAGDAEEPKTQIWLMDPFGGEPWVLSDHDRGVTSFDWTGPDSLVFLAEESETLQESTEKEKKDTTLVIEDEKRAKPTRLFTIDVESQKITRLTTNVDQIENLYVSPDGKHAVTIHARGLSYTYDGKFPPVPYLVNLADGSSKRIFEKHPYVIQTIEWKQDSSGFFATSLFTSNPRYSMAGVNEVYEFDIKTLEPVKVALDWPNGVEGSVQPTANGFIALLANGARHKLAHFTREGATYSRTWITGEHATNVFASTTPRTGNHFLYQHSTASTLPQWYYAELSAKTGELKAPKAITKINEGLANHPKAKTEIVKWKGAEDDDVEGILYYPHGYEAGKKYPLVLMIHGGPHAADFDSWDDSWAYPANLFCQRGAFVLKPNYHGSSNYGLKFSESIANGKYYDLEVPDIEKGVDFLIAKGIVDKDKLGVLGWSNGSILIIALTVRTTRYKCAGAGAGDVDWASDWGNCAFGKSFDDYYLGKSPLEDPKLYQLKSPFYQLDKVRTPTIIFFGTEDKSVPTQQGWMHFRALQQVGKTDVRFLLFPGEEHGPKMLAHQKRKVMEELAWFDKHLFNKLPETNASLKADSPLARALALSKATRSGMAYGTLEKNVLIPETVQFEEYMIGRFEVTRSQYAAYDKTVKLESGHENLPRASAY